MVTVTRPPTYSPAWIDRGVHAGRLLRRAVQSQEAEAPHWARLEPAPRSSSIDELSPRQQEILMLHVRGLTREEIAGQLQISANTVRNHVQAIYDRTGCANRIQALRWALCQPVIAGRILERVPDCEPAQDSGGSFEQEEFDVNHSLAEVVLAVRYFQDLVVSEAG